MSVLDRAISAHRPTEPKILVIDIELRPGTAYYWQPKTEWINPNMVIDKPSMICFDAKWYGKPQHIFRSEWEHGTEEMVAEAWRLLDEAHIVIGYNSVGFDVKHLNREIVTSQSPRPPRPFFDVDLIRTARSRFKYSYNSLNEVCRDLKLDLKLEHSGWDLWLGVMAGDPKAQRTMAKYNRQDVIVTENLYTRLRAWVRNHPNVNMWTAESVSGCHVCTSNDVEPCGFKYTATRAYPMFVCNVCGAYSQATHSEPTMTQHRKSA